MQLISKFCIHARQELIHTESFAPLLDPKVNKTLNINFKYKFSSLNLQNKINSITRQK